MSHCILRVHRHRAVDRPDHLQDAKKLCDPPGHGVSEGLLELKAFNHWKDILICSYLLNLNSTKVETIVKITLTLDQKVSKHFNTKIHQTDLLS